VDDIHDSPCPTGLPNAEVKLLEVTDSILLVLPVGSFLFGLGAEPAREAVSHLLQESVVCLREAEPMVVAHSVEFLL
jgi:hypothetical protein